jgi:hypothetical protein
VAVSVEEWDVVVRALFQLLVAVSSHKLMAVNKLILIHNSFLKLVGLIKLCSKCGIFLNNDRASESCCCYQELWLEQAFTEKISKL